MPLYTQTVNFGIITSGDGNAGKQKTNTEEKEKSSNQAKPKGHFCYVCGEHKANEKFSGRGHANHICRQCRALPVAERNSMIAARKAENMAFRYLNEQEINWLRKRLNDPRPEVREAAQAAHGFKFPRYERNMIKKGLTARSFEFYINGEVWNEYGDEIPFKMRFFVDNSGNLHRIDYTAPEGEQEAVINIGQQHAIKFLKFVVQQLNAPFWDEDLSDAAEGDFDPEHYPYFDDAYDTDPDDIVQVIENEQEAPADGREPIWTLHLVLNKGGEKTLTFYNQMHDEPRELFWALME
jgi:hypothetical protein